MSKRDKTVVHYAIDFKFPDGKVRIALREDNQGLKILGMRSSPKRKGLGRKALQFLKDKGLVGRPTNVMQKANEFWVKMCCEGLAKKPYRARSVKRGASRE